MADHEFVLVVGANGSGKTTLLRLLSTFAAPTAGRIIWDGDGREGPIRHEQVRRRLGVVAHHPLVYDDLTAAENLEFVLRIHGRKDWQERTDRWLNVFGLLERADERVSTFSRGMKQRLALARAFAPGPDLLLLDEPGTALDPRATETLVEQLTSAKTGSTIVLATHEPDPYRPLATRTLEIRDRDVHDWGTLS